MDQNNPWFKDLFLDNPVPRFIYNTQTLKIVKVNRAAIEQYQYPEEEFLTKTLYDLRAGNDSGALQELLGNLSGDHIYIGESEHITQTGELINVEIVANPTIYNGQPARLVQALNITEKKTAQANFRREQLRCDALLARSEDIITVSSDEGRLMYVSPAFTRITGYSPEEVLNTFGRELVHPDDRHLLPVIGNQLLLHPGEPIPMVSRLRCKDGSFIPVEGTLTNLFYDEAVQGMVANYREISQRLKAEETIQQSGAILQAVFDSAAEGFVITDNDLVIRSFNKVARKHIFSNTKRAGLSVGANLLDYVNAERVDFFKGVFPRVMSGENIEYQTRENNGGRWINYCLYPVQNDQEEIIGICVVGKDITEKIVHEEQLKLSEQRYRALIKEGSDLINIIDFEGNYQFITEASRSKLDAGVLGENAFQFVHADDRETLRQEFELLKTVRRVKSKPYRFRVGEDQYIWMETVGTNLMDEPSVQGIVINSHDVSDTMNHIRAIEERNTRLEEIAWIHSHLVRAPLASILGIIEILKTSESDFKELMPYLEQSAIQLDKVIGEITQKANDLTLPDEEAGGRW